MHRIGAKQYEVLTTAKDYKRRDDGARANCSKGCNEKFMPANLRETAEMMTSVREELTGAWSKAVKTGESVEKPAKWRRRRLLDATLDEAAR